MTTIAPPPLVPPPLTPGNRTAVRAILVIAASVLVIGCVVALGVTAYGINTLRVSNERKDLPTDLQSLTIDVGDATIRLRSDPQASSPRVDLRLLNSSRSGVRHLDVTVDAGGTRIGLTTDSPTMMDWGRMGEVTVTLPPRLASGLSVTTQQEDGALIVDADLDRLTARTADGRVVLNGAAHRVEITAKDGDVVSREPISVTEWFVAESVDGDVAVTFAGAAPRRIAATTRDGDVAIELPAKGPYFVRTRSGDTTTVRVPETTDPTRAVSEVTVRSDDGNVTVDTSKRS
ncbi:DUF4097 family beta strand repeat-containing protein [Mycolicibacterium hodleri]|uniref:DUF4097 domain-containing protein n=1 Tax=Mycolicibacterium hodleri TaxID=49897 RepID=A0A502E440_9MYCO|nr:DUF4097 family beta strand repeat-containing protein [Mycolicibacterium hodleri]TPG31261.1 hypothetical protein EAH80_25080 [Mycolicibacterium hodleri]